jgi:hypothetical protein
VEVNEKRLLTGNNRLSRLVFSQKGELVGELLNNYAAHLDFNFLFVSGDSNLRHGMGRHGLFLLIGVPFLILGGWRLWARERGVLLLLLGWWLAALLPASVPLNVPHALRSLNALLPLSLLIGYGVAEGGTRWWRAWRRTRAGAKQQGTRAEERGRIGRKEQVKEEGEVGRERRALMGGEGGVERKIKSGVLVLIAGVVVGGAVLNFGHFCWYYFSVYPALSAPEWQAPYWELTAAIKEWQDDFDRVEVVDFDNRFFVWALASDYYTRQEREVRVSEHFLTEQLTNITYQAPLIFDQPTVLYVGPEEKIVAAAKRTGRGYRTVFVVEAPGERYLGVALEPEGDVADFLDDVGEVVLVPEGVVLTPDEEVR